MMIFARLMVPMLGVLSPSCPHDFLVQVTLASTAVFTYAGLLPAGLYGYLWWASQGAGSLAISFLELVSEKSSVVGAEICIRHRLRVIGGRCWEVDPRHGPSPGN